MLEPFPLAAMASFGIRPSFDTSPSTVTYSIIIVVLSVGPGEHCLGIFTSLPESEVMTDFSGGDVLKLYGSGIARQL